MSTSRDNSNGIGCYEKCKVPWITDYRKEEIVALLKEFHKQHFCTPMQRRQKKVIGHNSKNDESITLHKLYANFKRRYPRNDKHISTCTSCEV